jgi:hypothetical protein
LMVDGGGCRAESGGGWMVDGGWWRVEAQGERWWRV